MALSLLAASAPPLDAASPAAAAAERVAPSDADTSADGSDAPLAMDAQRGDLPRGATRRQSLDDAWWTGPMLAPSAATLPRGRVLVEPYLFTTFKGDTKQIVSLTYILAGVTDDLSLGVMPTIGYVIAPGGNGSTRVAPGDATLIAQYRVVRERASGTPTISLVINEVLPTGRYRKLGTHPGDGLGSGAVTTIAAVYLQKHAWLPNGRILRMRLDLSQSWSSRPRLEDESVYGTPSGFRGRAAPGNATVADAALEYSLTKRIVLAADLVYKHGASTSVSGTVARLGFPATDVAYRLPATDSIALAPAVEYSWSPSLGVLVGVRGLIASHTKPSITPAIALNAVF